MVKNNPVSIHEVINGDLYVVSLGFVNTFLIDCEGLTLIDTGISGSEGKIFAAVRELGRQPGDIHNVLLTHLHTDHTGSLPAVKQTSGAQIWMHAADADLTRQGITTRLASPTPGTIAGVLLKPFMAQQSSPVPQGKVAIEHEIQDGEILPVAGGIRAVHLPGHTAGHMAFLWPREGGVLFVGDAMTRWLRFGYAPIYEDFNLGKESLKKLLSLEFGVLCFSHGKALIGDARQRIQKKIEAMSS
jgi:glyoxylase-like metal-dependent hydrolase (beta-lactamase superfamily II)